MFRMAALIAAFSMVTLPAFAQARCSEPYAPEINITGSTTPDDLQSMRDDAASFIAASDLYQACLQKAASNNPLFEREAKKLMQQNQAAKERVGKAFNAVLAMVKTRK